MDFDRTNEHARQDKWPKIRVTRSLKNLLDEIGKEMLMRNDMTGLESLPMSFLHKGRLPYHLMVIIGMLAVIQREQHNRPADTKHEALWRDKSDRLLRMLKAAADE